MIDKGGNPNLVSYNVLLTGLYKEGGIHLSLEIFEIMIQKNFKPTETTYTVLVEGMVYEGEKELAVMFLKELHIRQVISRSTVESLIMSLRHY
ncbi:hypothetical protein DCAR_0205789 [Daucus carota subsp. sativus]|uniref:Pentatricopeptide repeat-containing protein n=1 Tax=Daucus carota subsp. sativus TaxID=79200 RepID=A0AAF0WCG5_DAUCS|nr:hypothetical protein DCAR_0205789 [Daucus carota subsp. sativus]